MAATIPQRLSGRWSFQVEVMIERKKLPAVEPSTHPGQVLKEEYLDPLGLSVTELSAKLGVSRNTLSSIVNERAGVSPDMALRLSQAFNTAPEKWLELQYLFELAAARRFDSGWKEVEPVGGKRREKGSSAVPGDNRKKKRLPRA